MTLIELLEADEEFKKSIKKDFPNIRAYKEHGYEHENINPDVRKASELYDDVSDTIEELKNGKSDIEDGEVSVYDILDPKLVRELGKLKASLGNAEFNFEGIERNINNAVKKEDIDELLMILTLAKQRLKLISNFYFKRKKVELEHGRHN
jgi:hypothetical protein